MQRKPLLALSMMLFAVSAALGAGAPGSNPGKPVILSAVVEGPDLLIRGGGFLAKDGASPMVTLGGEILDLRRVSEHSLRVMLPAVRPGTYLLTVASGPDARQAGVMTVTLGARRAAPQQAQGSVLWVCANKRHVRVVDGETDCKRNESAFPLMVQAAGGEIPIDQDDDADDGDGGGDGDDGGDDGEDNLDDGRNSGDSDNGKGKGKGNGGGNGKGNGGGNGKGNGNGNGGGD